MNRRNTGEKKRTDGTATGIRPGKNMNIPGAEPGNGQQGGARKEEKQRKDSCGDHGDDIEKKVCRRHTQKGARQRGGEREKK